LILTTAGRKQLYRKFVTSYEHIEMRPVEHPLVASRLAILRHVDTNRAVFRTTLAELATLLIYESTKDASTEAVRIPTPLTETDGVRLEHPPLLVPILRAGLGMAEAAQRLLPESEMGFVGLARDETTHEARAYMEVLPEDLTGRTVFVLDPMIATGGSLAHCARMINNRNAASITVICALAAPEGLAYVDTLGIRMRVVTASVDERLNEHAYIVPGLGDAGDRQFGTI